MTSTSDLPPVNLAETRQPNLYASTTVAFGFAVLAVGLRFYCRKVKKAGLWLDDWLVFFALICDTALVANLLWWIPRGLGRHIQTFGSNVLTDWAIGLFIAELTYTGVIVSVKFSILALYWRIFGKTTIKTPVAILATAVAMWGIAVFLLTVLQCIPTRGFWDKSIKASCNVDSQKFLFAISIPNIIIDVTLLSLPVPYIKSLHVSNNQKRALISIFLLGGFVCIASIMRLVSVLRQSGSQDVTWDIIDQAIWAVVEAHFAIISACLPTLRPIWLAIRPSRLATKDSSSASDYRTLPESHHKTALGTMESRILKSKGLEDDETPFAVADAVAYPAQPHQAQTQAYPSKALATIGLDNMPPARAGGKQIRVDSDWDVQYGRHPGGHML